MRFFTRLKQAFHKVLNASYINMYSEFVLGACVTVLLVLTVASQLFIRSNLSKTLSVNTIESEGLDLDVYQRSMVSGSFTIRLEGISDPSKAAVWVNGAFVSSFSQNPMTILVSDRSLVEIDARACGEPFTAVIEEVSENVTYQGKQQTAVSGGYVFLARTKLNPQ